MTIRSAVAVSIVPRPRIRRTKISFSLSSALPASICSVAAAHPVAEAAHELVVEVAVDAADPEVVEQHPLAGQRGQHVDDLVALDERPQDRRQAAEVERHPAQEQGVAGDPVELAREDPDVLGAARDLDVQQLLEGHAPAPTR